MGAVLSFDAKESTKESTRHGTTGKRLLLPILPAGLAMSRAMELDSFHQLLERARARLFPPSKWAGLFPFAAYRRSAPPQLALGRLKWRCLGCFDVAWVFLKRKRPAWVQIHAGFFMRAGGPVARRRSFLFNWQVTTPNRRAARPVAERR